MKNFKQKTYQFFLFFLVIVFLGCKDKANELFPNNTIDVGYISYPPAFIINPNTNEKSGIFYDILQEIAKRNNLKINFKEELNWPTMLEALNSKRVKLIANPAWETIYRRNNAFFSSPIYFSPIGIFVRYDDNRFNNNFSQINNPNVRIIGVEAEINGEIARTNFPRAQLIELPQNSTITDFIAGVVDNRGDVTFIEPMFAYDYDRRHPNKIKNITSHNPIRQYANSYMFKHGDTALQSFLNKNIKNLNDSGIIERIIRRYNCSDFIVMTHDTLAK
ncbi:MAG: transporter substrate-binding domain-containing protein [Alphaproteobacteria bacterium]|nr:transporter substrate-binding domain-containing protein [Alphaproteobacteria bacterium]